MSSGKNLSSKINYASIFLGWIKTNTVHLAALDIAIIRQTEPIMVTIIIPTKVRPTPWNNIAKRKNTHALCTLR